MQEVQKFAIENIYCSPAQDRQFKFKMVKVNNDKYYVRRVVDLYRLSKQLPDQINQYNVYVLGNIDPKLLNLLRQSKDWFRDEWVNLQDDMNLRNYIGRVYSKDGVIYPRAYTYYSFIDQNSLAIAIAFPDVLKGLFTPNDYIYFHVYSSRYFNTTDYTLLPTTYGIKCNSMLVKNNIDKASLQAQINSYLQAGGDYFTYVNGYYTSKLDLNIPDNSYVEYVYDQSIISKEDYPLSSLRTFQSTLDSKLKFFIYRNKTVDQIQYWDDTELYIKNTTTPFNKGLYYYLHLDYAMRNVTDKDYSLYTTFVNNQAQTLSNLTTGSINDKVITMYVRKSGIDRNLVYSSLKLNELYKLPPDKQQDVINNTNYTIQDYRAENLEASDYFKVAEADSIFDITKELATSALGYNAISYYFGMNIIDCGTLNQIKTVNVPLIYQEYSTVYEYSNSGVLLGVYDTTGPIYPTNITTTRFVEFVYGKRTFDFGSYYHNTDTITPTHNEYRLYSAVFSSNIRATDWVDITDKYTIVNNTIILNELPGTMVKIQYLNQIHALDIPVDLNNGLFFFPITVNETRPIGSGNFPAEIAYKDIVVYLNGYRLTQYVDYFLDYPYICITNKTYINYSASEQNIHIRMTGPTLDYNEINSTEIRGFVNNGVLGRNNLYDIRDDRLLAIFIDGKLYPRSNVRWAEEDNTIRLTDPLNGLPYTVFEPFTPIKSVTGIDTEDIYEENVAKNKRISDLFNIVLPEPPINQLNAISNHHYIYSPVVSKVINDILENNIDRTIYTNPYTDQTIINLIDSNYSEIAKLDPIKYNLPDNLVEIHPHFGNSVINLDIFQYRFVTNLIRIITNNNPSKINISGYLAVTF